MKNNISYVKLNLITTGIYNIINTKIPIIKITKEVVIVFFLSSKFIIA